MKVLHVDTQQRIIGNLVLISLKTIPRKCLYYLYDYNNLLKQRNEYLKSVNIDNYDETYIEILDNQLCDKSVLIYKYRFEFINNLNRLISNIFNDFSSGNLYIKYINNVDTIDYSKELKNKLLAKLKSSLKRDIINGSTSYGPHRDDIEYYLNNKNVREYGSQGQQRLAILTMKFAEVELFNEKKGEYPILLLDDIFSELDILKRNAIIKYLNKGAQVFITSTDINDIDKSILKNSKIFNIKNGNIV